MRTGSFSKRTLSKRIREPGIAEIAIEGEEERIIEMIGTMLPVSTGNCGEERCSGETRILRNLRRVWVRATG
jgi:hypothetical protein